LRELLATAPDAASVAAIARTAGFPVSERDLWQATAAAPEEQAPAEVVQPVEPPRLASEGQKAPPLPDPWFPEEPLTRFVHQAQGDAELREALATAPDAAAVASIARAAGYPISEVDLWLASGTTPDELAASLRPPGTESMAPDSAQEAGGDQDWAGTASEAGVPRGGEGESPEAGAARGGEGDPESVSSRPGEGAVDLEGTAGFLVGNALEEAGTFAEPSNKKMPLEVESPCGNDASLTAADVPMAEEAPDLEEGPGTDPTSPVTAAAAIQRFLQEALADAQLRQALAQAPDASAVAAIAREAGHPMTELTLWLASDASFEEAHSHPQTPTSDPDPLTLFLRAVEVDPDLQIALASAPDADTVAAIARIAGFPLTAADLWAVSDAAPQELELERLVEEMLLEPVVIVEC
jgi:predicted ribosomally synthesized peptide with nif11-like leader